MSTATDQDTVADICNYAEENEIKEMFKEYLKRYVGLVGITNNMCLLIAASIS